MVEPDLGKAKLEQIGDRSTFQEVVLRSVYSIIYCQDEQHLEGT